MANPKLSDWDRLVRTAKYLLGHKRYVMKFGIQRGVYSLNCFGDSDFAGDAITRNSTSGGMMMLGDHVIKGWSSNQTVIALSTGEAELYAINKPAATGMASRSMFTYLGTNLDLRAFTHASTGKVTCIKTWAWQGLPHSYQ